MRSWEYRRPDDPTGDDRLREVLEQTLLFEGKYWETYVRRVGPENVRSLHEGERTVGSLAFYRTGQWFGGQRVSMDGVAAVGIVAECRGSGGATFLMSEFLRESHSAGTAISTLFASTQKLYRKAGYERAGNGVRYELPLAAVGISDRGLSLTPVDLSQPELLSPLADRRAARTAGNLARTPGLWERLVTVPDHEVSGYLVGPGDDPAEAEGYVVYHQPTNWDPPRILTVRDMVAETPAAARRLWTTLADHSSVLDVVRWVGPAVEPLLLGPAEDVARVVDNHPWMVRIVNVTAALAERGYPAGVAAEVHLEVEGDDVLPENNGRYTLSVENGRGTVTPGGPGDLVIDIGTLAPLFTGLHSATELSIAGRLSAEPAILEQTDLVFTGPEPWMPEGF